MAGGTCPGIPRAISTTPSCGLPTPLTWTASGGLSCCSQGVSKRVRVRSSDLVLAPLACPRASNNPELAEQLHGLARRVGAAAAVALRQLPGGYLIPGLKFPRTDPAQDIPGDRPVWRRLTVTGLECGLNV